MSHICKGRYVAPLQRKCFMALDGYVFAALQVSQADVGTIQKMVDLVNDVFEAGITYKGDINVAIDEMWGYVSGLSKSQRKKLRNKNLTKVQYPMKSAIGMRRKAKLQHQSFHTEEAAAVRQKSEITKYREENDRMSLEQFGKLFTPAVDKSTVLRWERGQITPRRAIEIEGVTGISRNRLLPDFFGEPVTEAAE